MLGSGLGLTMQAVQRRDPAAPAGPPLSIFGWPMPAEPPTVFPGNLIAGAERSAADAARWSRQNNDPALSIAPGMLACNGTNANGRWIGYTDETAVAVGDRLAIIPKIEAASGNIGVTSNVGNTSTTTNTRLGWKQGCVTANAAVAPRLSATFNPGVAGHFSQMQAWNITQLLDRPWFIVLVVAQSNVAGAQAVASPALDTPVEGCVVFPGTTNSYTGAALDGSGNGLPMLALDPVQHSTLNGSAAAYGGGPSGAFLRELRKWVPGEMTVVMVATAYGGGFKPGDEWNRNRADGGPAYLNFWKQARHVRGLAPAGSVIGGLWFCQGESDLGPVNEGHWQSADYGAIGMLNAIRAEPGWGEMPIVVSEIGMDPAAANVASMIALQGRLATGSGDPLEFSRCAYVPRPASWALIDGAHYDQPTNRQRGIDAALALRDLVYSG